MGIGEHPSTVFLPSSTKDFLKSEPLGRVFSESVLGECAVRACYDHVPRVFVLWECALTVCAEGVI